jgi:hypothetical protein
MSRLIAGLVFLVCVGPLGCLFDDDHPCGSRYVLGERGACFLPDNDAGDDPARVETLDASSSSTTSGASTDSGRAPTGLGASCESSADCAGYDATYCETFQSHTCFIQNCTSDPGICPAGWSCCETVTRYGLPTLCLPDGNCPG